jgi:MraZ protein
VNNLLGNFPFVLDQKSRIIIPSAFRNVLLEDGSNKIVLVQGLKKNIQVLPEKLHRNIVEELMKFPSYDEEVEVFKRIYTTYAFETEFDKQGRFVLKQELKDYAGIRSEGIIAGIGDRMEIWAKEAYAQEVEAKLNLSSEELLRRAQKLNLKL